MTTESDTPSQESGPLDLTSGGEALAALLDPPEADEPEVDTEVDPPKKDEEELAPPEGVEEGDDAPITLEVDGKQVTLTKAQIADAYKNGLRQEDATKKWMAAADTKRAAQAETEKAKAERATYTQNLQKLSIRLEGALQEQAQIDWQTLIKTDPVEAMTQQHLQTQRQAALHEAQQRLDEVDKQNKAEQLEAMKAHLAAQQQELLAKLPQWKDPAKSSSERDAIKTYLSKEGYSAEEVLNITDNRAVVMSRKAMLYDQMVAKATAAAKKVQTLPEKVIRPGTSAEPRSARNPMLRGNKSLSPEDAGEIFSSIL